jgi:NlpC/P60 family protein
MITGRALVEYAQQIGQGRPYVLGAAGPNAYDCSGLVLAVFRHFGIADFPQFPREAGAQARWLAVNGTQVDISQACITPGAILAIDLGPVGGGAGGNHIGFCLTPGISFEARSRAYGIGSWPLSAHHWTGGYLAPGVDYTEPVPEPDPEEDTLPEFMIISTKYKNIFGVWRSGVIRGMFGDEEYLRYAAANVQLVTVRADEIETALALAGPGSGPLVVV